jgi:hypothetical protein
MVKEFLKVGPLPVEVCIAQSDCDMLELGDEMKPVQEKALDIIFGKCLTKKEYFEEAKKYKILIEAWGWQADVNNHFKAWQTEQKG